MTLDISSLVNLDIKSKKDEPAGVSIPGVLPSKPPTGNKFRVRYQKLDLDQLGDVAELEKLETKALQGQGVYVLSKKDFVFMDRMFMLINYIEEIDE